MTAEVGDLAGKLGCPAAILPGGELQGAEFRQRIVIGDRLDWEDGHANVDSSTPDVPELILRYAKGVSVVTMHEGRARALNMWWRICTAFFPLGDTVTTCEVARCPKLPGSVPPCGPPSSRRRMPPSGRDRKH